MFFFYKNDKNYKKLIKMLKTVGTYETETKVFVFKVKEKTEAALVNIFDSTNNYVDVSLENKIFCFK